jgi:hypothetical protein
VGQRRKIEDGRLAPLPLDPVRGLVLALRDVGLRHVGNPLLDLGQIRVVFLDFGFERADLYLERFHLRERLRRGLAFSAGDIVAAATFLLEKRQRLAPRSVERDESREPRAGVPFGEFAEQPLGVRAEKLAW